MVGMERKSTKVIVMRFDKEVDRTNTDDSLQYDRSNNKFGNFGSFLSCQHNVVAASMDAMPSSKLLDVVETTCWRNLTRQVMHIV